MMSRGSLWKLQGCEWHACQAAACRLTWSAWPRLLHLLLHDLPQLEQPAEVQLRILAVKAALLAQQEVLALQQQQQHVVGVIVKSVGAA
jgi:hypothetical protein